MKLAPGVQVGPYQIVEQIGRGGMATVFKAYQPALERMVALKVLPDVLAEDPQFRERFRREAVAIAKLRHPSILTVYDHGEFEDLLYIVTEFVEGGTFAGELGKPLGVPRTTEVLGSIASALDYAHRQGVLHRDVKPSNILINKEGAAILGDFGLARMMAPTGERLTRIDMVVGTPEYMSPEQCAGKDASPAADQYSLGVVGFEALTGHVPYEAETPAAVMLEQIQSPLPMPRSVNPSLSEAVERALMRALAKDPAQRFPTCGDFVKAIETETAPAPAIAAPTLAQKVQRPAMFRALSPWQTAAALALASWTGGTEPSPDPAQSMSIAYPSGSIDLHILKSGGGISAGFDGPSLKNYVADFVIKADTGSDFGVNWQLIAAGDNEKAEVYLHIDVAGETMTLILSPYDGSDQAMTAAIPVPGLQRGTTADIAAVVNSGTVALYLNGNKVGEASETKATGPASPGFYMNGTSGTLHVLSLRYYALP